ncbi:MAG: hypothetical protein IPL74_02665 [Bacteroidetes bacterium]|nr:hypothetical protein [Bacteroidota bacterium]
MKLIFIKTYIENEEFDNWIYVEKGDVAELIDEITGRVELTENVVETITFMHVPSSYYIPLIESDYKT